MQNRYSNTSQTRGSKLAKFSNSRFRLLLFTSKLAVPFTSIQIRELAIFRAPKIASLEVLLYFKKCYYWSKKILLE